MIDAAPGQIVFELIDRVTDPHTPFETPAPVPWAYARWVDLPAVDVPTIDTIAGALATRHDSPRFADRPISLTTLARLLAAGRSLGCDLDVLVWVRAVDGIAAGLYLDTGDGRRLGHLSDPGSDGPADLFLQRGFDQAAVVIAVVADLTVRLARDGEHGYRRALFDGGRLAHHVWLTACGEGLVGSTFTGFIPSELRTMVSIDGFQRLPILALACGHAATA